MREEGEGHHETRLLERQRGGGGKHEGIWKSGNQEKGIDPQIAQMNAD
jgi:hypothetical protein